MHQTYKHIIWDWDGTLLDDTWLFVDIMNTILKRYNMPSLTLKKYREIFGFPIIDYYKKLGFKFNKKKFNELSLEFISIYDKRKYEANLYKESKNILKQLSKLGFTHSILSAQYQVTLIDLIKFYKIDNFFNFISGLNNQFANSKIEKGIEWVKTTKPNLKKVVLVGDTRHDYEVSKTLGIDCFLLSNGHNNKTRLKNTGAKVMDNLSEFLNYIILYNN